MNKILGLMIFILCSCSHQTKTLQASKTSNAFAHEGFVRWTQADLERFDNKGDVLALQAQCHLQKMGNQDDLKLIMTSFSDKLSDHQEQASYWNQIAACYLYHQDYAKAQFIIDFALNKKPSPIVRSSLLNNKGLIQLRLGKHDLALLSFKESIKSAPEALTPQFNLSLVYLQYGHVTLALPILKRLHSKNTKDEEIMAHLGLSLVLMQQYQQADKLFSKLGEAYKRRADVTVMMAINELEQGNPENARHLMLRQSGTSSMYLKRMSQITEKRINMALEQKRIAQEQARATASKSE